MVNIDNIINNSKLMGELRNSIPPIAKKYLDYDEIESEINFIILNSINKYDPKKASIKTYLSICIKNRFQRIILAAKKRRSAYETADLSTFLYYDKSPEVEAVLNYLKGFSLKTLNNMNRYVSDETSQMSDQLIRHVDQIMSATLYLVQSNNLESYGQSS